MVVHAIDTGRGLDALRSEPAVGDVIGADDAERVLRLLRATCAEVQRRTHEGLGHRASAVGESAPPLRLLLVDGFARFEELYERLNRGEALDLMTRVARDGRAVGVHLAVSAQRRGELPVTLAASLGTCVHLRAVSEDDAVMAGLPPAAADQSTPPGRGHLRGELVQLALPPDPDGLPLSRDPAEVVRSLPRALTIASLPRRDGTSPADAWCLPLGVEADRLEVARLDLTHQHALVAGPPRSGVSTALATLAAAVDAAHLLSARSPASGNTWASAAGPDPSGWEPVIDAAIAGARSGRRTLLALDGLPELLERPGAHELEARLIEALQLGAEVPLRLAIGGEVDAMARCYSDVVVRVRSGRTGVLLQVERDLHAGLLHAVLPLREELPACPGRGWLVAPGSASAVQVARP